MIFHNTKLINLGETEVSLFFICIAGCFFSSPRDADNLSLRFENVCISRRGLLFYCTSFWNLQISKTLRISFPFINIFIFSIIIG